MISFSVVNRYHRLMEHFLRYIDKNSQWDVDGLIDELLIIFDFMKHNSSDNVILPVNDAWSSRFEQKYLKSTNIWI